MDRIRLIQIVVEFKLMARAKKFQKQGLKK